MAVLAYITRTSAGTKTAPAHSFTDDTDSGWYRQGAGAIRLSVDDNDVINAVTGGVTIPGTLSITGTVYINDTANANVTLGLTINQGANDNQVLAFKSSDVTHGVTTIAETDTYGFMKKTADDNGGLQIYGLADAGATGVHILATTTTPNTGKNTGSPGIIALSSSDINGTGIQTSGADANILTIADVTTVRFIFDTEGSAHADVEWIAFDEHNDLALIEDMETLLAPDVVQRQFGEVLQHDQAFFEDIGLLHDVRDVGDGRTRGMLNTTKALMLSYGAIRQLHSSLNDVMLELAETKASLRLLEN